MNWFSESILWHVAAHFSHLQQNRPNQVRAALSPKNILAPPAPANLGTLSSLPCCCWGSNVWHTSLQTHKCSGAACSPQSLESDQSDAAICASVKVADRYTVDGSSWIRVRLATVSQLQPPTLLITTSIWAPLSHAGGHWSSLCHPPWAEQSETGLLNEALLLNRCTVSPRNAPPFDSSLCP